VSRVISLSRSSIARRRRLHNGARYEGSTTKTSTRGDPSIRGRPACISPRDGRISIVSILLVEARVGTREPDESIEIPVCSLDHQRRFPRLSLFSSRFSPSLPLSLIQLSVRGYVRSIEITGGDFPTTLSPGFSLIAIRAALSNAPLRRKSRHGFIQRYSDKSNCPAVSIEL